MQKIRKNASAFKAKHMFGLPEYSRHSFHSTNDVPIVKINSVPITNWIEGGKDNVNRKNQYLKLSMRDGKFQPFF